MRVGIDAHCLGQKKTGNETYTHNLVSHLGHLDRDGIEYFVYLREKYDLSSSGFQGQSLHPKVFRLMNPLLRIPFAFGRESKIDKLDVFHAQYVLPYNLDCRTVLTVHDVLYERFPQLFPKLEYYWLRAGVRRSCQKADSIITVSETSKRDIVEFYDIDPARITVTYLGADPRYHPLDREIAKKALKDQYGIEEDFILYVGAIQPRKNIARLLSAFARLKNDLRIPHKLVIVGPKAWMVESTFAALQQSPARDDVIVAGYVPTADLPYFYNAATVFVYISLCEGFGLPVIEAMACGAPTITSRGSSLEEVSGQAAVLVDPSDETSIAEAMRRVLTDSELRSNLRELGIARSRDFSYCRMASQTREIYRSLAT